MKTKKKAKKKVKKKTKKKKALTNAQRQTNYRKRTYQAGLYKINSVIDSTAHFALARLAKRYAVTQRKIIEDLIAKADERIRKRLALDSPAWDDYHDT